MEILDFDSKTGEYFFIMKIIIYQEAHILEKKQNRDKDVWFRFPNKNNIDS